MKKFFCISFLFVQLAFLVGCENKDSASDVSLASISDVKPFVVPVCSGEQCGVVNQQAEVLVPFGRTYFEVYPAATENSLFVKKSKLWSVINPQDKTTIVENLSESLDALTPGLFATQLEDGWAIVDTLGKPINNARYSNIATTENNRFMIFLTKDQQVGVLDSEGNPIARFFGGSLDFSYIDHLIILRDEKGFQLVDMKNQRSFPVNFNGFYGGANGMYVVRDVNQQWGVINAEGGQVMPMQSKFIIGVPSAGRVAYSDTNPTIIRPATTTPKCGYLDFNGAVVIPAQFEACSPFGDKVAMVKMSGSKNYSLIDREGKPFNDKSYTAAYWVGAAIPDEIPVVNPNAPSDATFTGDSKARLQTDHLVPNMVTAVELGQQDRLPYYGMLDLNTATYKVDPKYARLRVLNSQWIEFVRYDSAESKALDTNHFVTGVMDFNQKVLVEPSSYRYFVVESGVPYIFAYRSDYTSSGFNILSPEGKVIVQDYWYRVAYDPRFNAFFGYNKIIDLKNSVREVLLRSAYTGTGVNIFKMEKDGACQDNYIMYNYAKKPLWNTNSACNPK